MSSGIPWRVSIRRGLGLVRYCILARFHAACNVDGENIAPHPLSHLRRYDEPWASCTGSIIEARWILTVCFSKLGPLHVHACIVSEITFLMHVDAGCALFLRKRKRNQTNGPEAIAHFRMQKFTLLTHLLDAIRATGGLERSEKCGAVCGRVCLHPPTISKQVRFLEGKKWTNQFHQTYITRTCTCNAG